MCSQKNTWNAKCPFPATSLSGFESFDLDQIKPVALLFQTGYLGRIDSLVETDTHIYIMEYKLNQSAQVALEQIKQKRYYQAYWNVSKPVVGVGVNFSSESKNIEGWVAEELAWREKNAKLFEALEKCATEQRLSGRT